MLQNKSGLFRLPFKNFPSPLRKILTFLEWYEMLCPISTSSVSFLSTSVVLTCFLLEDYARLISHPYGFVDAILSGWNALSQRNDTLSFKFVCRSYFLHFTYTFSMWSLTLLDSKSVLKHFINVSTVALLL